MKVAILLLCLVSIRVSVCAQVPSASAGEGASNEWPTAQLQAEGLSAEPLQSMESSIRSGDLKKITSVLIARHGKLVYENYFNGSAADALQDTRSATKSITDILIGIAIDKRILPGVSVPVLHFFPTSNRCRIRIPVNPKSPSKTSLP